MHQLDQGASQEKIKANEGQQRRWIVEHSSRGFFNAAALFDEVCFQQFTETAEVSQGLNHFFQRLAPCQRRAVDVAKDGLHDLRGVGQLNLFMVNFGRRA